METGCDKLARQICTPLDWAACLESCRSAGATLALELGPGTALTHMASARFADGRARAIDPHLWPDCRRGCNGRWTDVKKGRCAQARYGPRLRARQHVHRS